MNSRFHIHRPLRLQLTTHLLIGAARNLPGVKELFEAAAPEAPRCVLCLVCLVPIEVSTDRLTSSTASNTHVRSHTQAHTRGHVQGD